MTYPCVGWVAIAVAVGSAMQSGCRAVYSNEVTDWMQESDALRRRLEQSGRRYHHDGDDTPVEWMPSGTASAAPDGHVNMNAGMYEDDTEKANELRLLRMVMAHEVSHINHSVLTGKEEFMDEYPSLRRVAGAVCNILEDKYVDCRVREELPGMRSTYVLDRKILMENAEDVGELDDDDDPAGVSRRINGLLQLSKAGWVKGYNELTDEIKDFLNRQKPRIDEIPDTHDPAEREAIMHLVMEDLEDEIPEGEMERAEDLVDLIDALKEAISEMAVSGGGTPSESEVDEAREEIEDPAEGEPEDGETPEDMPEADMEMPEPEKDAEEELSEADDDDEPVPPDMTSPDIDYDSTEERDEKAVERIEEEIAAEKSGLEERMSERDSRISGGRRNPAEDLRAYGERSGIIPEVREAFDEMASADGEPLSESGYRVDIDQIVEHASGNLGVEEFYREQEVIETGDRAVNVTLDLSGSMRGEFDEDVDNPLRRSAIGTAKLAIGTLATAAEAIGDDFTANGFRTEKMIDDIPEDLILPLITGPGEDFDWTHLDSVYANNADPTFAGVNDGMELLAESDKSEKVMFVITDGKATVSSTGHHRVGPDAIEDAREAVNSARNDGIEVVGIGIGTIDADALADTFGSSHYRETDIDNLADVLVEEYKRTLKTYQE